MLLARACAMLAGVALAAIAGSASADSPTLIGGTKLLGGGGGAPYHLTCPDDSFLVGGVWRADPGLTSPLNYFEPVCAYVQTNGKTGPHFNVQPGGGAGSATGVVIQSACPADYVVFGADGMPSSYSDAPGPVMRRVTLYCTSTVSRGQWIRADTRYRGPFDRPPHVFCPFGKWANAVYGGAGSHVDSFGFVCDDGFGPAVQSAQPSPPPEVVAQPCQFCDQDVIHNPTVNNTAVDVCLNWGKGCGKPAADAFCQSQGFNYSTAHTVQQNAPPTYVMGDNTVCNETFCTRFTSITCNR